MSRFEIILRVDADHQADVRDLADDILKATRVALIKGQHPGVDLDVGVTVAQPARPRVVKRVEGLPVRTFLPEGPSAA